MMRPHLTIAAALCIGAASPRPSQPTAGAIAGEVREERSGRPIDHALVLVRGARLITSTDATGRFRLENVPAFANLKPTYDDTTIAVTVRKLGYFPEQRELVVRANVVDTLVFLMRPDYRPVK